MSSMEYNSFTIAQCRLSISCIINGPSSGKMQQLLLSQGVEKEMCDLHIVYFPAHHVTRVMH